MVIFCDLSIFVKKDKYFDSQEEHIVFFHVLGKAAGLEDITAVQLHYISPGPVSRRYLSTAPLIPEDIKE